VILPFPAPRRPITVGATGGLKRRTADARKEKGDPQEKSVFSGLTASFGKSEKE